MYTVYVHINKINNKRYIGITGMTPKKRWKNGHGYVNNYYFFKAIKKYGWDNFKHEILFEGLTEKEACEKEIELIAEYRSNEPEYGYNISAGGEKTTLGLKLSESARKRMSEAHKGNKHQNYGKHLKEETRRKISESEKGKRHSEQTKEKMRQSKLGKKQTTEHIKNASVTRCKAVLCVETLKKYKSLLEAANDLDICKSSISEAVNGKRKTAGGYHFLYITEAESETS